MKAVILSRLDELAKTVKEIRSENAILRKEILGIRDPAPSDSGSSGIIESKPEPEGSANKKFKSSGKINSRAVDVSRGNLEEYPVFEITAKTLGEERERMKAVYGQLIKTKKIKDGKCLRGTTIQEIANSIFLPDNKGASCALKLCNFLNTALMYPQYDFYMGSSNLSGPLKIPGNISEVFTFSGGDEGCCSFLCSFAINENLRLTIRCQSYSVGVISLGIGFTPENVPTDRMLDNKLSEMPAVPDIWMHKQLSNVPLELFVTRGNLLVRGYMANGPRSVVHVEILEINGMFESPRSSAQGKKGIVDGKSVKSVSLTKYSGINMGSFGTGDRIAIVIEIVNCLNVPLRNQNNVYYSSPINDFVPSEILPFHRERFFGEQDDYFEGMFSYQIELTDVVLVVALRVVADDENSFAASFVQHAATIDEKGFESFMDESQWTTNDYRVYAKVSDGLQSIQIRNIRAEIQMTEEEKSVLKIRIFPM